MTCGEYLQRWSVVHGYPEGTEVAGIARAYLWLNYYVVQPLVWLRLSPNLVTLSAPLIAATALLVEGRLWIALLILTSLLIDGFDGALALIRVKSSAFGGVWDGIIDRITEFFWIGALYYAGISPALLLAIWIAAATQEYGRAKLTHVAGSASPVLGVVTICERPVRGLLVSLGFIGEFFSAGALHWVALSWLALQTLALAQFIVMARRQLR